MANPTAQILAPWHEQGADKHDPVLLALIQSMASRISRVPDGDAKHVLEHRLNILIQRYESQDESHLNDPSLTSIETQRSTAPSVLGQLVEQLTTRVNVDSVPSSSHSATTLREHYPELPILDEFRSTLSRTRAVHQVIQSEEQVHINAGPLNSNHLVHRTLAMMRDVSPGYLHQFLSYLDALAWVDQLHVITHPSAKDSKRIASKSPKRTTSRTKHKEIDVKKA